MAVLALPVVQTLGRVALLANGQPLHRLDAAALAVGALALLALPFVPMKR
ncbi:hypothetical protein [Deinococcus budaensis]|uniref:Uncharacterized protein n=1 Tax=Deinococcus budaensis TaxID=1665626 RepID=A0A7W8GH99_9DEIO|nr:hypothetical protein [Deinococcus budaensis]MBB5235126.1 hypothetical protein [Deinococcus budaensis]